MKANLFASVRTILKIPVYLIMSFSLFVISPIAYAQDIARGEQLYQSCIECHGSMGQGNPAERAPMIGGQFDWYIVTSLNDFKSGERENPDMEPFIADLDEQDFKDLAAYISTLEVEEL